MSAFGIALAIALCLASAAESMAQTCQGCICDSSSAVHPATSQSDCIKGCAIVQLVCSGRDIIPNTTVIGLGFSGQPKNIPNGCMIRTIPDGGMLTGKPASGCSKADEGK
ncbi:MAG: hypothetical protein JOZ74_09960 [Bradyrhizobium sp.]|nr:hypothetical protein [Bradyrhizobium sp.]